MLKTVINRFRLISYIEGLSYLFLIFVAMPVKYLAGNPYLVKIAGMTHGVLFILFVLLLLLSIKKYSWSLKNSTFLFILSLIPFGSFIIEKRIKNINS